MKVPIEQVAKELKDINLPPSEIRKVIEKLNFVAESNKRDPHAGPKGKKQYVILISDPKGEIPKNNDLVGWALEIEESASPKTIHERIRNAAIAFNNSRRGRVYPVSTVGETLENVPRRFFKTDDPAVRTLVKNKAPVLVHFTNNKLA